jgi:hypothetical protein
METIEERMPKTEIVSVFQEDSLLLVTTCKTDEPSKAIIGKAFNSAVVKS